MVGPCVWTFYILKHAASEAFLCFRAHLAQVHTQQFCREECVLGRCSCLDIVPQDRCQALGNRGQTQGTDSAPLPLSLPMFGVSEN